MNQARGQLAGEGECIRVQGALALVAGKRAYSFSSIVLPGGAASATGVQGVIKIEQMLIAVGSGFLWVRPRPFPWFTYFRMNNPVPQQARPTEWSQFGQGSAPQPDAQLAGSGGSLYVDPIPDQPYNLQLDCVCYPYALATDADPEALPYLWTDSVPYYAAYLALLSAQTNARQVDAQRYFSIYTEFVNRARRFATPQTLPGIYSGSPDLTLGNKLGVQPAKGGG